MNFIKWEGYQLEFKQLGNGPSIAVQVRRSPILSWTSPGCGCLQAVNFTAWDLDNGGVGRALRSVGDITKLGI